jgi:hypothetical protein
MPFTRSRAVMAISLALLAGAAMYSDAMAQGLVVNPRYPCAHRGVQVFCGPTPTVPHTYQNQQTFQYQHTFQSPFKNVGPGQCPPGYQAIQIFAGFRCVPFPR